MAEVHTGEDSLAETVNELYWASDQTVDDIVDQLGIGRNTLYSAVRPQSAGASCPDCGKRLVYTNRSNRAAGTGTCRNCGVDVDLATLRDDVEVIRPVAGLESGGYEEAGSGEGWSRWRHELAAVAPERAAMIGGAAALGVVVGAVAARAVREMR